MTLPSGSFNGLIGAQRGTNAGAAFRNVNQVTNGLYFHASSEYPIMCNNTYGDVAEYKTFINHIIQTFLKGISVTYTDPGAYPYNVVGTQNNTDVFVSVDTTSARTINLPNLPNNTGTIFFIKDRTGSAHTNNITVTTPGGTVTIDGATSLTMNQSFQCIGVVFNGANYELIFNSSTNSGFTWSDKATNFNAANLNGYFCTAALTATLPAAPAEGDTIMFNCDAAAAIAVKANTGQFIRIGNQISSSAGTATSNSVQGDALTLVYRTTGTTWHAQDVIGSWLTA